MQRCRCDGHRPNPVVGKCGACAVAFSAGMITALLLASGKAAVLVAFAVGCLGVTLIRQ